MGNYRINNPDTCEEEITELGTDYGTMYLIPDRRNNARSFFYGATFAAILATTSYQPYNQGEYCKDYESINEFVPSLLKDKITVKYMSLNVSLMELQVELRSYGRLEDNWDGYGAIPALEQCVENAILLTKQIPERYIGMVEDYYPNPHGTITLAWENRFDNTLSLEIGKEAISYYVEQENEDPIYVNKKTLDIANIKELENHIATFLS